MSVYLLALAIGVVAGLRAMMAPAAVSWAALPRLAQSGEAAGSRSWVVPGRRGSSRCWRSASSSPTSCRQTPSRTVPIQFGARILTGALAGRRDRRCRPEALIAGAIAGSGRRGDRHARRAAPSRSRLATAFGSDRPAALIEDAVAHRRSAVDRGDVAMKRFDAIILGAGQAGPPLAGRLTAAGMTVALVERKLFGGTCVNTGCMPTKTLVASAYAAHLARRAADYGVVIDGAIRSRHGASEGARRRGHRPMRAAASSAGCAACPGAP